jgi:putative zinc finger protein
MVENLKELDARLSAYLDGELSEADMAELEALIAGDGTVAVRLEALAFAKDEFEASAREIDDVPMSASLTALVQGLEDRTRQAGKADNVVAFPLRRRVGRFVADHRAIAASVAVAAGIMSLMTAIPAQVADVDELSGTYYADSEMGQVFEATASGTVVEVADGLSATPRFTFASGEDYCRVVDVASAETQGRLVACRIENVWRVAAATYGSAAGRSPDAPYRTASAAGAKSIEDFLDVAMSDAPLGLEAEAELMEFGWILPATDKE